MGGFDDMTGHVRSMGPGYRRGLPDGLVAVTGDDAVDFLQRLCSQDVAALAPGQCVPAAFLNPKGKLLATCQALRTEEGILLEVEMAAAMTLAGILEQFQFAEKLEIQVPAGRECGAWMGGPEVFDLAGLQPGTCVPLAEGIAYAQQRHGMCWVRYHAPAGFFASPPWQDRAGEPWGEDQVEAFRICAGLLRMGADADQATLAMESGLDDHVSLSKGCYPGQEIVARIHTYGHVNRKLCLLAVESADDPAVGSQLMDAEEEQAVGRIGSSARLDGGNLVALGYLASNYASTGTTVRLPKQSAGGVTVCGFGG